MARVNLGIFYILLVCLLQSIMLVVVRFSSAYITTGMQVFAYCAVPLLFYIVPIFKKGLGYYKTTCLGLFIWRGLFSATAVFLFFYAAQHIQLGIASIFYNSTPIYIPLLAMLFLNEKTSVFVYSLILIAMLGVVLIIHPSYHGNPLNVVLIAFGSGILMAFQQIILRKVAREAVEPDVILFYQCIICTLVSVMYMVVESAMGITDFKLGSIAATLFPQGLLLLLVLGAISYLAQLSVTKAFRYMTAPQLAPFLLVSVPLSAVFGYIFWRQTLSTVTITGIVLVLLAVVSISCERQIIVCINRIIGKQEKR